MSDGPSYDRYGRIRELSVRAPAKTLTNPPGGGAAAVVGGRLYLLGSPSSYEYIPENELN
ncbi:MAG TPA: hypothetical protein VIX13_01930 [Candidatus Eisenbacteria bacterium]